MRTKTAAVVSSFVCCLTPFVSGADSVSAIGAGGCLAAPPNRSKGPPARIFRTDQVKGPVPTSDWCSSVAWVPFSEPQYAHPLALRAVTNGLAVFYPSTIATTAKLLIATMPPPQNADLILGHSQAASFPDARLDGYGDWTVRVRFATGDQSMTVTYGHGLPFVYALYNGGTAKVSFRNKPQIWAGGAGDSALALTVNGKHYALFGPAGSTWQGTDSNVLVNSGGQPWFSLALLPDNTPQTLARFQKCAHAHVADTRLRWQFNPATAEVTTTFEFDVRSHDGGPAETLFALYPHQWRNLDGLKPLDLGYNSIRGPMKLGVGTSFSTRMKYPGVLPALPNSAHDFGAAVGASIEEEAGKSPAAFKDTYWEGKHLGKLATLSAIAEARGEGAVGDKLRREIKSRLEHWLSGKSSHGFFYETNWGTLIGYPASYGSDAELNDHHFHYGYFIRAAAEIARFEPEWAAPEKWGGMVRLLIRDIASPTRDDRLFPFLRCLDLYAGHSWAAGHARFADGNNQESSSEAMNAWCGIILLGDALGDTALRDLGIYLFTTEMSGIEEYWFDVHGGNHPPKFEAAVATMIWGGKSVNETWFTANPEQVHGINWLPLHGGSLYLGRFPDYVGKNYAAMGRDNKGIAWDAWVDLVLMYRAMENPADARQQLEALGNNLRFEAGNSKANTLHWLGAFSAFGQVARDLTADAPLYAVFQKEARKTYVVYQSSPRANPRPVKFSDGTVLTAKSPGYTIVTRP